MTISIIYKEEDFIEAQQLVLAVDSSVEGIYPVVSPKTSTTPGNSTSPSFGFLIGSIAVMVASLVVFYRNRKHRK